MITAPSTTGNCQHPAGCRSLDRAFGKLLGRQFPLGPAGGQFGGNDVAGGAGIVQVRLGDDAPVPQCLGPAQIGAGLPITGHKRVDLGIKRGDAQRQLVIDDLGDDGALGDLVSFINTQVAHGAADTCARRNDIGTLDRSEDRLQIIDLPPLDTVLAPGGAIEARTAIAATTMVCQY